MARFLSSCSSAFFKLSTISAYYFCCGGTRYVLCFKGQEEAQNGARVSAELELLARGLFPPPSLNCPGARGEGGLTEAASPGGAPAAEATTVLGTAGRTRGQTAEARRTTILQPVEQKPHSQKDRQDEKAEGYVPDEGTR